MGTRDSNEPLEDDTSLFELLRERILKFKEENEELLKQEELERIQRDTDDLGD